MTSQTTLCLKSWKGFFRFLVYIKKWFSFFLFILIRKWISYLFSQHRVNKLLPIVFWRMFHGAWKNLIAVSRAFSKLPILNLLKLPAFNYSWFLSKFISSSYWIKVFTNESSEKIHCYVLFFHDIERFD